MFWAFGIAAILLLAYFISAMACGFAWDKCGKKSSSSSNSNEISEPTERFLSENPFINPEGEFFFHLRDIN